MSPWAPGNAAAPRLQLHPEPETPYCASPPYRTPPGLDPGPLPADADAAGIEMAWGGGMNARELRAAAADADALVTAKRPISADLIRAAAGLRLVQVQGRAPWAVDRAAAAAAGVPVSVLPHRGRDRRRRADHCADARGSIASWCRDIWAPGTRNMWRWGSSPCAPRSARSPSTGCAIPMSGNFTARRWDWWGWGDIALEVARRARAFDMEVVYFKRSPLPRESTRRWSGCATCRSGTSWPRATWSACMRRTRTGRSE